MKKFVAIILTQDEFIPSNYPALFRFFEALPYGIHFQSGVIAFEFDGNSQSVHHKIQKLLKMGDEAFVFELRSGAWATYKSPDGDERYEQLQKFLGVSDSIEN